MASYPFVTRVDAIDYSSKSVEKAEEAYRKMMSNKARFRVVITTGN